MDRNKFVDAIADHLEREDAEREFGSRAAHLQQEREVLTPERRRRNRAWNEQDGPRPDMTDPNLWAPKEHVHRGFKMFVADRVFSLWAIQGDDVPPQLQGRWTGIEELKRAIDSYLNTKK